MPTNQNNSKKQFHLALIGLSILLVGALLYLAQNVPILAGFYTAFVMLMPLGVFVVAFIGIWSIISGRKSYKLYHDKYSKWTLWLGLLIALLSVTGCIVLWGGIFWGLEVIG